jgi:hypothetical protein
MPPVAKMFNHQLRQMVQKSQMNLLLVMNSPKRHSLLRKRLSASSGSIQSHEIQINIFLI